VTALELDQVPTGRRMSRDQAAGVVLAPLNGFASQNVGGAFDVLLAGMGAADTGFVEVDP